VLINITGGLDLTLFEVNEASSIIREAADEDANIIFGAVIDESMRDEMKITVIATGFDKESADAGLVHNPNVMPAAQPRYLPRTDELPSRSTAAGQTRSDDLDVPAFIRKKAD
jgi:cell division protein FtsZ